ncbi:uncharacterized protein LOC130770137 isoform X1 [Actinidia eriantha]|uniref:uncharacterized protein LOC130770137 isoform X1 n=1 Tax=Actinidia eriantha TaxID=165200 RepID=UPI0025911B18|nr:uncharacterized protein LOC130770137 isoform X1 [Actinidia eriantha]XP_057483436.1 uncharacterized protein LOC130770137 isoform X1 [Actinidia eriantha]XP_057483437.1 uncharacterized protein LOC130770137 isoform X1 [Actinidia eriantha]XP_057483438.1 uncharacterized protein LOC130770137 isoform X1 [Actinidia eriantha]XP_057483440.1 uncharacterized protein LOC130770137 isoform X1 [Actinidia eriantha]XP_057483441.1 uncharacterized protein LOC130770137 isoform X1 [Actinidia eriantha]XP_05748344
MGFDNECIVNIQSLAGEYFCPVCRLLVYPNEALQSQCTHLYCKPCLAYVVGTTRACPYDGYLVTEADSKPLIESNKALAETIGKIAVHCLYHRSGCHWQGPLSECNSHCSGCAFGNSPVVCNRCGIQIVHRQVQEHAQNCPGVQFLPQQPDGAQDAAPPTTATPANAKQTQTNPPGELTSQTQTSQTVAAPQTGQDFNPQNVTNSQAPAVAPAAVPTPEQWYQQQYQLYYQQYPGSDLYQPPYQNYYPYQQQVAQQYQQHAPHVPGQHQPQVHSQPPAQTNLQPQPQVQPHAQPPSQTQPPQAQIQPHAQPQPGQHVQAPLAAHAPVNPQHQLHPAVQPPTQMQLQVHPPPHGHPHPQPHPQTQPQPYAGPQAHPQPHPIQPHSQQHMQIAQYQLPQSQAQHAQPQIQPQPHSQVHPQHQSLPQQQPPTHLQSQPQAPLPNPHPQLQPPPQLSQPQTQSQHPPAHAATGNQSYPQHQAHQQMQLGAQHPPPMHPQSGPIPHPVQVPGQFPQQPPQMRLPQSHPPMPNQQRPVLLSPHGQVPNAPSLQQQPIHPHAQQPGHHGQQHSLTQPMQQPVPQQHVQHRQPFPGQTPVPYQNQLHPHDNLVQQPHPMQSQLRPQGPPHTLQQNSLGYMSSQPNVAPSHGFPPHQSQNYAARPMMPNHGIQSQPFPQTPTAFTGATQVRPPQFGANQPLTNQTYPLRINNQLHMHPPEQQIVQSGLPLKPRGLERQGDQMPEKNVTDQKDGSPSERTSQKEPNGLVPASALGPVSVEGKNLKSEMDVRKSIGGDEDDNSQVYMHDKVSGSELQASGNASAEPSIDHTVKKEGDKSRLESSPGGKSVEIVAAEHKDAMDGPQQGKHSTGDDTSLQKEESFKDQNGKLPKDPVDTGMLVSGGANRGSQAIPPASVHISDSSAQSQTPLTGGDRSQERNLSQFQSAPQGPGVDEFRRFPSHGQVQGKGFMHSTHQFPPTEHMAMHYGPSAHKQRLAGTVTLQAVPPGPPHHAQVPGQPPNILRPQGPGHLPQPGQSVNPPDHFQPPHPSIHHEMALGGIPGPSTSSLGKGPSQFVPPERSYETQSLVPQGHYNQIHVPSSHSGHPRMSQGEHPVSFNPLGGIMGMALLHDPDGPIGQQHPINPIGSESFPDQRSLHLDGRHPDSHLIGSSERHPFGQSPGIEANAMRMKRGTGTDYHDERFKRPAEEGLSRFPMEPVQRVDQGKFEEDLKQFPRHPHWDNESAAKFGSYHSSSRLNDRDPHGFSVDAVLRPLDKAPHGLNFDAGAPRFLPPYRPGGSNDAGDRVGPVGPDANIGRVDSLRTHTDFLGPVHGFGRHHMDQWTPRSPGREYPGFQTRDFGGLSGFQRNLSSLDDTEGRESHPFGGGPRSFNFPSDPVGNSFHESRFPLLRGHLRRGELDGPGNLRSSDGQDIHPSHLRRGEFLGPRTLPGHLRLGEPAQFGAFPGPGNFPHHLPLGEPLGGNRSDHLRLGEPGFRSSYSVGMNPFDNSRKRKAASMGWCRICKVDCETVESLDLHSQTREHQQMAMDMVLTIKQQNAKKQKTSNDQSSLEEPKKSRGSGYEVCDNKP